MAVATRPDSPTTRGPFFGWMHRITSSFLLRVVLKTLLILWVVVTMTFLIIRALPGNPVEIFILRLQDTGLSAEEARTRAAGLFRIDLNAPLPEQYADFMGNLLRGDLGDSYILAAGKPVTEIVFQRLPWTLFSVGTALLISFVIGMFLGTLAAYQRNSWVDHTLTNLGAILDAIPNTLTAIIFVLLVGVTWKLVPVSQMRGSISPGIQPGFTFAFFSDVFAHWLIPGSVYIFTLLGGWTLAMRSSTVSTLGEDYVTVARARGLPNMRIMTAYVGRNASLPLVTNLAIQLGFVVGGAALIEQIFVYQGVGLLLNQAITKRDYPVMQGILLATTIMVLLSTALADLLYGLLDPRIRIAGEDN